MKGLLEEILYFEASLTYEPKTIDSLGNILITGMLICSTIF